jgi:hypothetical protein
MVSPHECVKAKAFCTCDQLADEPNPECDVHGYVYHAPRCRCGKFVPRATQEGAARDES